MQKSKVRNIIVVIVGTLFLVACTSKTIVPVPVASGPVSFSNAVVPIFTKSCAFNGCHATGFIRPDLTPTHAYNSLISMNLVDTLSPKQSVIYIKISPGGTMNQYIQNPADEQIILSWIQQGAKNN